jgi:hypothetical protein
MMIPFTSPLMVGGEIVLGFSVLIFVAANQRLRRALWMKMVAARADLSEPSQRAIVRG